MSRALLLKVGSKYSYLLGVKTRKPLLETGPRESGISTDDPAR